MRRLTVVPTLNATTQLEATRVCASVDMKRMNMDNAKVRFDACAHAPCGCQNKQLNDQVRFIYTERTGKRFFTLIFVTAQCEHQIGFSMNPTGSDVTFSFVSI